MGAREVAAAVHGSTGSAPAERLAFIEKGIPGLEQVTKAPEQYCSKAIRDRYRQEIIELGLSLETLNPEACIDRNGNIDLVYLSDFLHKGMSTDTRNNFVHIRRQLRSRMLACIRMLDIRGIYERGAGGGTV